MFGQIVHCVNDRFCSDMSHAIELISTERTGIPGLRLIAFSFLAFLVRLNTSHIEKGTEQKQCSELCIAFVLYGPDRGKTVKIGICGGRINSPTRIGALLYARHGVV